MAINITSGNNDANDIGSGARVVVRNSSGIPYVVVFNNTDNQIDVWKGNGTTPTGFSEPDAGNGPSGASLKASSVAIYSDNVIHISYWSNNTDHGGGGGLRYVQFRADGVNDDFINDELVVAIDTYMASPFTAITIDSSGVPHIVWLDYRASKGTDYATVLYINKVGGSWNGEVKVDGAPNQRDVGPWDITVNSDNYPVVVYIEWDSYDMYAALGDANDATAFTLKNVDPNIGSNDMGQIATDSGGNVWIAYYSSASPSGWKVAKQSANWTDAWTISGSGYAGDEPICLAINGTDCYILYADGVDDDIKYDKYNGASWSGEATLETGTYYSPKIKWAFSVDYDSTGTNRGGGGDRAEIDYVFTDTSATSDILFASLSMAVSQIKELSGVAQASIKKVAGVAIASVKKVAGVSNV